MMLVEGQYLTFVSLDCGAAVLLSFVLYSEGECHAFEMLSAERDPALIARWFYPLEA